MADFVAFVDRTIGGTKINIKIEVATFDELGEPEAIFAGHAIGLLRNEVESTCEHIALMRAFQEGQTRHDT